MKGQVGSEWRGKLGRKKPIGSIELARNRVRPKLQEDSTERSVNHGSESKTWYQYDLVRIKSEASETCWPCYKMIINGIGSN